jgi:hypothetical protein
LVREIQVRIQFVYHGSGKSLDFLPMAIAPTRNSVAVLMPQVTPSDLYSSNTCLTLRASADGVKGF